MRRSSAPSQISFKNKRPKFCTPYLDSNEYELEESKITEQQIEEPQVKPTIRSNEELLKLITGQQTLDITDDHEDSISADIHEDISHETEQQVTAPKHQQVMTNDNASSTSSMKYFNVVWCKLSKKKHKTWEGDAILKVKGSNLYLFDTEGKEIGHTSGYKACQLSELNEGQTLVIGSKEVEIMDGISEERFKSGRCFSNLEADENLANETSKGISKAFVKPFVKPLKSNNSIATTPRETSSSSSPTPPRDAFVLPRPSGSHEWNNNHEGREVGDVWVDPFLSRHLRPHQKEGVAFLYKCILGMNQSVRSPGMEGGAILADEMGLGKTIQCISLIWTLYKQGPYGGKPILRRVLVVVPGSLVKNWVKEFKKWLTSERLSVFDVSPQNKVEDFMHLTSHPVMIISYDMLVRNIDVIKKMKFDLLICDEGHKLKNSSNKTTQSIKGLNIRRRIILTGTPVQNDLQELYNLVDFCVPEILGTSTSFKHVFENPILASRQSTATSEEVSLGQERAFQLNQITSQLILRRTQEINNKYLPPKVDIVLFCSLTPLQVNLYNRLVNSKAIKSCLYKSSSSSSLSSSLSSSSTHQHLACISALRKLCNHPYLIHEACRRCLDACAANFRLGHDDDDDEEGIVESQESLYDGLLPVFPRDFESWNDVDRMMTGGKMVVLSRLLSAFRREKGGKVVVVSNYTKTLDLIESLCKVMNYQFLRLDGKMVTSKRQETVDRFNNPIFDDFVFLLSTKAGGVGLNLVGASRLVLFDIDWNPANDLQAMARIWRDGQKRRVYVYRLLSSNSIEERMYQRQVTKQGLSGVVVDLKSNDSKNLPTFSVEQMKELFAPVGDTTRCMTHEMLSCGCRADDREGFDDLELSVGEKCNKSLFLETSKKNSCMDELLDWKHIPGPNPDLSVLDPLLNPGDFNDVTFAFSTESNA